ncbi:conserved hypothetical protein [Prosthecochloris aestuarii DSM 271]|uniref:SMODS and SLOG-associating 2TM effector domain-containing protein n=1 Tax=Prosthecochloris aestuarii (strain DSM 271 / SK 413) TaxID=290512 RepID=B4S9A0_PROA2|nr:SLATT domain-containing protein [Prosthecochloris aestuarii]ACF45132.1 conserved hypothetical protein [Prosthecochloris aestuarii DSM 271]
MNNLIDQVQMDKYLVEIQNYPELINKWNKRLREGQFSHYRAERYYKKYHYFFGVPAMIFAVISGSAVYLYDSFLNVASLGAIVGVCSFISSLLIGVQTFVNFSGLAEKHLSAAVKYGVLRRDVERIMVLIKSDEDLPLIKNQISLLKSQIDDIASNSPNISHRIWRKATEVMDKELNR